MIILLHLMDQNPTDNCEICLNSGKSDFWEHYHKYINKRLATGRKKKPTYQQSNQNHFKNRILKWYYVQMDVQCSLKGGLDKHCHFSESQNKDCLVTRLTEEGRQIFVSRSRVFPMCFWLRSHPSSVLCSWNVCVGRVVVKQSKRKSI